MSGLSSVYKYWKNVKKVYSYFYEKLHIHSTSLCLIPFHLPILFNSIPFNFIVLFLFHSISMEFSFIFRYPSVTSDSHSCILIFPFPFFHSHYSTPILPFQFFHLHLHSHSSIPIFPSSFLHFHFSHCIPFTCRFFSDFENTLTYAKFQNLCDSNGILYESSQRFGNNFHSSMPIL